MVRRAYVTIEMQPRAFYIGISMNVEMMENAKVGYALMQTGFEKGGAAFGGGRGVVRKMKATLRELDHGR